MNKLKEKESRQYGLSDSSRKVKTDIDQMLLCLNVLTPNSHSWIDSFYKKRYCINPAIGEPNLKILFLSIVLLTTKQICL